MNLKGRNQSGFDMLYRKYVPEDFPTYFALVSQDAPMKYITGRGMRLEEAKAKFQSILEINNCHPRLGYFQVHDVDSQEIIGECKLVTYLNEPSMFEIGYLLKSEYWKQGYGTKICKHLLALAFELDPQKDIVGIIDPENAASKALLEKFGFESYFMGVEDGKATEKFRLRRHDVPQFQ